MSYGIEIYDEDGDLQLTSEASTMLFVDLIQHAVTAGAVYAWPEITGRQIAVFAMPWIAFTWFSVSYPGGVPTLTTTVGDASAGSSSVYLYVFAL